MDNGLDRSPAIVMPARHDVYVEMIDLLPARAALVDADRNSIRMQLIRKQFRNVFHRREKRRNFRIGQFENIRRVYLWNHKRMARRPRHDIQKCDRVIVLENNLRRNLLRNNLTEQTILVISH